MNKFKYIFAVIILILSLSSSVNSENLHNDSIVELSNSKKLSLTDEEKQWLKEHPVIKVGSDPNWAPIEYRTKDGNYEGITIDYLNLIEKKLNIKFEFAQDEIWKIMFEKAKEGELDFISNITKTEERKEDLIFTSSYISLPVAIYALEGITHIRDLNEFSNKKVAVVDGYITDEKLSVDYPEIILVKVKNTQEGLKKVKNKDAIAFVGGMVIASYYIKENNYKSIRLVGETEYSFDLSMAVRKDWPILRGILQKSLDSISDLQKNNIYYSWISISSEKEFDYSLLLKITIPLSVLLLIFIFWNRRLRREIKRREQAQLDLNFAFKKLKDTQTQLVQTEKMATVGVLTAGIAHEIKNPLNYISLGLKGLKDGIESILAVTNKYEELLSNISKSQLNEIEKLKEKLEFDFYKRECLSLTDDMHSGVETISEITKSLNTFSYFSGKNKVLVDINTGIKSTLILLRSQYKNKINIIKELGDIPEIKCFPGKLNQVYVNLISNAIQAIEEQGTITIKTFEENDQIIISIKDSGKGMSSEEQKNLFKPFYTSKPMGQGTGLGLAISKNIIDEHQGEIEFNTQKGKGSEFIIRLPIED